MNKTKIRKEYNKYQNGRQKCSTQYLKKKCLSNYVL